MKTTLTLAAALAALMLWLPTASAQDDDDDIFDIPNDDTAIPDASGGDSPDTTTADASASTSTLGIGFSVTTSGLGALEAEYWIGEKLAISGLGRLQFISPDPGDSIFNLQIGFGGLLVLKQNGPAMLMGGGRFLLGFTSAGDGTTSIALEAPLRLQAKVADKISVHVEGGLAIGIDDGTGLGSGAGNDFTLQIGTNNLFGGVGMTIYL